MTDQVDISCVVPVFRGGQTLRQLAKEIDVVRRRIETASSRVRLTELLLVDDGSTDESSTVMQQIAEEYSWVHTVTLSRNFGQHSATIAGILQTSGDWVVTLDEDLQHRPEWIWSMLHTCALKGGDVMYAQPVRCIHTSLYRDWSSRILKTMVAVLTHNPNIQLYNSFRVIRGTIARSAAAVASPESYFDVGLGGFTDRVLTCPLPLQDPRKNLTGVLSGYSFRSLVEHARRLVLSSPPRLLRYVMPFSSLVLLGAFGFLALTVIRRLFDPESIPVQGWASIMAVLLFFGATTIGLLAVILEFLGILLLQGSGQPVYFVVDRASDAVFIEISNELPEIKVQTIETATV